MSSMTQEQKPSVRTRASTMRMVRADYRKHTMWSYAECADFSGITVGTICKWVSSGNLPVAFRRGPFRIDALAFQKYLRKE